MLKNIKKLIIDNYPIIIVLVFSIILHILAIMDLGFKYSLNSDDLSYMLSGIEFVKSGTITMHGVLSAQIMPGLTFIIAFFSKIFGVGYHLWVSLKIFYMLMGLGTIIGVYRILRLYTNKYIASLPCLFFLAMDYIWMDNLILTETPFILFFVLMLYHTLSLSINPNKKDYILVIVFYILDLFMRPNIGIYPLFLFIFLLWKKYDFKLLIKQCFIAGVVLLLVLTPWAIRNYKVFGKFIPLTYGIGNPLLMGTYQGYNYPLDEELDYVKNVDKKMNDDMKYYLNNLDDKDYMTKYYSLEYDGMKAKYRMHEWWNRDKKSMLLSYCFYKPKVLIYGAFYWHQIFGVKTEALLFIRKVELFLALVSVILVFYDKNKVKEMLFLGFIYASQVALYSYTFAFDRYGITLFFLRYIVIGFGIDVFYNKFIARRKQNEGINDNSSV